MAQEPMNLTDEDLDGVTGGTLLSPDQVKQYNDQQVGMFESDLTGLIDYHDNAGNPDSTKVVMDKQNWLTDDYTNLALKDDKLGAIINKVNCDGVITLGELKSVRDEFFQYKNRLAAAES